MKADDLNGSGGDWLAVNLCRPEIYDLVAIKIHSFRATPYMVGTVPKNIPVIKFERKRNLWNAKK